MFDVGGVHAGVGHHETQPVLDDDHARHLTQYRAGFAEDDFDEAWILLHRAGDFQRARRRRDPGEFHIAVLGLGDDLLRQHDDIAGLQRGIRARQSVQHQRRQIGAGRNPGNARQRNQLHDKNRAARRTTAKVRPRGCP